MSLTKKLEFIQSLVRTKHWTPSSHVLDYIKDGEFEEADVERCVATGVILRVEADREGEAIDGKVYVISGTDQYGLAFATAGKIIEWLDGASYFVITAYKESFDGRD